MHGTSPSGQYNYYSGQPSFTGYSGSGRARSGSGKHSSPYVQRFSPSSTSHLRTGSTEKPQKTKKPEQPCFMERHCGKISLAGGAASLAGIMLCFSSIPLGISLFAPAFMTFWLGFAFTGIINQALGC